MSAAVLDQISQIFERAKNEALVLVHSLSDPNQNVTQEPLPEWLTDVELARYWRIFNKDDEPVTAGIISWANRPPDEHPLPCARMGDLRRFHRATADKWAWEESECQKAKATQKRLHAVKKTG
ncbi:MAG TPA: hypothetical protein VF544_17970 [Pyrinomonadaceae bacterium]|jgi:hypothetical protein